MIRIYYMKEYFQSVCVCTCACMCVHCFYWVCVRSSEDNFYDSGFRGIKLRLSGLHGKCFYSLSHLAVPQGWDLYI